MHKFYITNNLGGGGTNVSRFVVYKNMLQTERIGILLNYYYLNPEISKSTAFDQTDLKDYTKFSDVHEFLAHIKAKFIEKERISEHYPNELNEAIQDYLLDSGGGNLIRDLIQNNQLDSQHVDELIKPYHDFASKLDFDIIILLDYALKYTYKAGERTDKFLKEVWQELSQNEAKNLLLLERSLADIKERDNFNPNIFAPLHGFDFKSFVKYTTDVLQLESTQQHLFDGFALGGIADTRKLGSDVWGVPDGFNSQQKSAWLVSTLARKTKDIIGNRPLHILGAGNIYALPFLIHSGATSSDCHSPWRRASEPGTNGYPKYMIPLLGNDLGFLDNSENVFAYKDIGSISEVECNCPVCSRYSLDDLKTLYDGANEETYYCKLLVYFHSVFQYDYLIRFIENNPTNYLDLLLETPDAELNEEYRGVRNALGN